MTFVVMELRQGEIWASLREEPATRGLPEWTDTLRSQADSAAKALMPSDLLMVRHQSPAIRVYRASTPEGWSKV